MSDASNLDGKELATALIHLLGRHCARMHPKERDAITEAARRVERYDRLQDVVQDLRLRLPATASDPIRA